MSYFYLTYFTIVPKKPSIKLKAGKSKATVSYKKVAGGCKYEIKYSTKKSSGFKALKKTSSLKVTKKGLKKNKKYYFRVRAYKKVGKVTYYSSWATKPIKIK